MSAEQVKFTFTDCGGKLAVVGSRSFKDYAKLKAVLDQFRRLGGRCNTIISGGAHGADELAARYARENGLQMVEIKPEYKRFGCGAPLVRNRLIVDAAHAVLAFWKGKSKGTAFTLDHARRTGKPVIIEAV